MLTTKGSRARTLANKFSGTIGFFGGIGRCRSKLFLSTVVTEHFSAQYLSQAKIASGTLSQQIDFLIVLVASGAWTRLSLVTMFFGLIVIVGAIICGVWVSDQASKKNSSFVLLTNKAISARDETLKEIHNMVHFGGIDTSYSRPRRFRQSHFLSMLEVVGRSLARSALALPLC